MSDESDIMARKRERAKHRKKNKVKPLNDLSDDQKQIFWGK